MDTAFRDAQCSSARCDGLRGVGVERGQPLRILATRMAMLLIAALGLFFVFQLGIELCRSLPAVPALLAPALLLFSPLFYTQSMLAQLDMPAMVLTALALILFLRRRYAAAACVCTLLVLVKRNWQLSPRACSSCGF